MQQVLNHVNAGFDNLKLDLLLEPGLSNTSKITIDYDLFLKTSGLILCLLMQKHEV